jgi:LuxR family glucitol operon transcriptional activator
MNRTISAVRNTCFAILAAIETDLRTNIASMSFELGQFDFLPPDVKDRAGARFTEDTRDLGSRTPDTDLDLLPYTDFADLSKMLFGLAGSYQELSGLDVKPLASKLQGMAQARNRVCHSRPLHEDDLPHFLGLMEFSLNDYKTFGWDTLSEFESKKASDPTFILRLEIPAYWRMGDQTIHHNLPLPDYDDTSFLGRITERKDIKKYLLGHHPVITIVGEGGVGKSALAMQCAYDLMDLGGACPYEVIVWVSLKTKALTSRGIENIRDSFVDVLGLMQDVASQLGSQLNADQELDAVLTEVVEYLSQLKVLLIIDNFETLTTNLFRQLLSDIPTGSKVLITSRVGLGELENRYPLDTLDQKTATTLLRKFAKTLNLNLLAEGPLQRIEKYSNLLFRNPLLIKWFVQSVAAGADPERLSGRSGQPFKAALQFCFENLFERLTNEEREVLHLLAAARRHLTFTELMFLIQDISKTDQIRLESAITTLHGSSMIKRSPPDSRSADVSTRINLTDVATEYIAQFAPPDIKMLAKVQNALKKLREASEQSVVQTAVYKYELFAIRANTKDERICAIYLNQALQALKYNKLEEARNLVRKVTDLLPSYVEAYRVASFIETKAGDLYKASEELDNALQFDKKSAVVYYQYAQLLLQKLEDAPQALIQIDNALRIDPGDEALETLRALALNRVGRCKEATEIYERQLTNISVRPRKWRITTRDQASECFRRWSEQDLRMKDFEAFKLHIDRACSILEEAIAVHDFDQRMGTLFMSIIEDSLFFSITTNDIGYAVSQLLRLVDVAQAAPLPPFRKFAADYFSAPFGSISSVTPVLEHPLLRKAFAEQNSQLFSMVAAAEGFHVGHVIRLPEGLPYGFIRSGMKEYFFHKSSLLKSVDWNSVKVEDAVRFELFIDQKGRPTATRVVRL